MSPTLDTATLETPILEAPILETNATEVMADAGFAESDSSALVSVIESSPEEALGGDADTETHAGETSIPTNDEESRQAQQNSPIKEMGAKKGRQRQEMPRKSMLHQLAVPLPTQVLTLAPGEAVTGEAMKIGRRPDKNSGDGQSPVPAAKDQTTKAKAARVKSVAKANAETPGEANPVWEIKLLPVEEIGPNPFQPREQFSEEEMEELAGSVAEHGVQTPILVRPRPLPDPQPGTDADSGPVDTGESISLLRYELVAGERRLRASRMAGRKFIPAIVRGDLSDQQAAELALIENVQRSSLNVIEEARGYKRLMLRFRFTEARIAKKVGKTVPTIQAALKLLALPEEVQNLLLKKQLSAAHGHELLKLAPHPLICTSAALVAVAEKLPATSLASNPLPHVRELKRRGRVVELGYATKFDWKRECQECPHKAFVTSGYGSYCLAPEQWKAKQSHAIALEEEEAARVMSEARQQGEAQVEISKLSLNSYRSLQWNEPPAGCSAQCPCRSQAADPRDASKSIPVCLNPERLDELRKTQREAQEVERERHCLALWEESVQRLAVPGAASAQEALGALSITTAGTNGAGTNGASTDGVGSDESRFLAGPPESDDLAQPEPDSKPEPGSKPEREPTVSAGLEWEKQIAWNKIVPLLVLPVLSGENCSYSERGEWEETAREVALQMGFELPWDEIMGGVEDSELLPRLELFPPLRLLFLGGILLLRQEALYTGHWGGETPLMDFVLGLQSARQGELEVGEGGDSEEERQEEDNREATDKQESGDSEQVDSEQVDSEKGDSESPSDCDRDGLKINDLETDLKAKIPEENEPKENELTRNDQ